MLALWVGAMYLKRARKNHWIATIPAIFMTMVTTTYICNAPIGFGISMNVSYLIAVIVTVIVSFLFFKSKLLIKMLFQLMTTGELHNQDLKKSWSLFVKRSAFYMKLFFYYLKVTALEGGSKGCFSLMRS
jgi:carbon starvation protein CstA